jgi:hypothetical protein
MTSTIPADLLELKARFETWRTNRKYVREPIPDELWKAAAEFCVSFRRAGLDRLMIKIKTARQKLTSLNWSPGR